MTDLQSSESDVSKDLCSCSALLLIVLLCAPDRPWIKAGIIPNSTRCFSVAPPPASRRRAPYWPSFPRIAPAPSTPSRLPRSDPPPPLLDGKLMMSSEPYLWIPIRAATRTGIGTRMPVSLVVPAPSASPVLPSCTHPYRTSRIPKPPSSSSRRRTLRPPSSSKRSSLKNPRSWASPSRTGS